MRDVYRALGALGVLGAQHGGDVAEYVEDVVIDAERDVSAEDTDERLGLAVSVLRAIACGNGHKPDRMARWALSQIEDQGDA